MKTKLLFILMSLGMVLPLTAQNIPSYVPTNGLVGWWPFNGNANDESGNGNHGTVNGATLTNDRNGNANSAYSFDGISNYISLISNFDLSNRTISVWFKKKSQDNSLREILNNDYDGLKNGHTIIGFMSSTDLNLQSGSNGIRINKIDPENWNFVLITRDNLLTKYFLNGELIYQENNDNIKSSNSLSQKLRIGVSRNDEFFFNGIIDDIGIYNRALSQEEINKLYIGCIKETANLNPINGTILKNGLPITLSATPAGGMFEGQAITNGEFAPANATLGTNTVSYYFTNKTGCIDTTQFKVMVYDTVGNICSTTDTLKIKFKLTTGINANQLTIVNVYPNPTSDILILETNQLDVLSGYQYKIVDLQGKVIYNKAISSHKTVISINTLGSKGIYLLHIVDVNGVSIENKKIVLE